MTLHKHNKKLAKIDNYQTADWNGASILKENQVGEYYNQKYENCDKTSYNTKAKYTAESQESQIVSKETKILVDENMIQNNLG